MASAAVLGAAATRDLSFYGATGPRGRKEWEWESRGHPWWLLLEVVSLLGRQIIVLIFIVAKVVISADYMMSCDPRQVGYPLACVCEYTKAYVRCYPLLALVVSILIASRWFLYLRFYYQILKHGNTLLEFDTFPPYRDPVFLILVVGFLHAVGHFALHVSTVYAFDLNITHNAKKMQQDDFQARVNEFTIEYVAPAALFLWLLYSSYDIAEHTLPFSKYFEEDRDAAVERVKDLHILCEHAAMTALSAPMHDVTTASEAYSVVIDKASKVPNATERGEGLSRWRLVATWWPAKVLLDRRLTDEESRSFRYAWYTFSVPALALLILTFHFGWDMLYAKWLDIAEGQLTDICGIIVYLANSFLILRFSYEFTLKTFARPFMT